MALPRSSAFGELASPLGAGEIDRQLLSSCVHCGFCLPSCPTYLLDGEEADSPRGRIGLIAGIADAGGAGDVAALHLDRCLSCLACVSACPSGVKYGELIEGARAVVERTHRRSAGERLKRGFIFSLFPYPRRLRAARRLLQLSELLGLRRLLRFEQVQAMLPRFLTTLESLAPPMHRRQDRRHVAVASGRGRVGMLDGCVQGVFFPEVNRATVRVLHAEGFEVVIPSPAACCGALSSHAGRIEEAKKFARATIDAFPADLEVIIVNAAGCGSAMKDYGHLLADDAAYASRAARFATATRDVSEFLAGIEVQATRHPLPIDVAYHDACHLAHAQQLREEPRRLLEAIPGVVVHELAERDICCGSAGIYNLLQPDRARRLGARKAASVARTGAALLVSGNPGCLMQLDAALRRSGTRTRAVHTIEMIDASIRGIDAGELG